MALQITAMAEVPGRPRTWVHAGFLILIVSRILQPIGLQHNETFSAFGLAGNLGTYSAILIPVGFILYSGLL